MQLPILRLALRNVARNRRRTLLAASAVFFGVLALVCIRGMINGVQAAQRLSMVERHSGALQVHRAGYMAQVLGNPLNLAFDPSAELLARLRAVPGVAAVSPRLQFGAMLNHGDATTTALFTAFDPAAEYAVCPRKKEDVSAGAPLASNADRAVVPSAMLARRLKWPMDGTGAVLGPDAEGILNAVEVKLLGTSGLPNVVGAEKRTAMMPLSLADELLRTGGRVTELAVGVVDLHDTEEVAARIRALLGDAYEVHTWRDLAPQLVQEEQNQDIIFGVMVAIFVLAALTGIANTLLVNMLERTREIGTMLAMGTRRRRILALFLVEGVLLALLGCVAGLLGGAVVVAVLGKVGIHLKFVGGGILHIYPFSRATEALALAAACGVGAMVASFLPARRASLLTPAQALSNLDG